MKLYFQVVSLTKKDQIISFKDFSWDKIDDMMNHILYESTNANVQAIKITRWNAEGEKQ